MPVPIPVPSSEPELWPSTNERGYNIPNEAYGTIKPIKVIAIGAGISGICLAHEVDTRGENLDITIYELGDDVGGTWFWNAYPGVRCDIPSVNYQMSWSPKTDWPEFYADGAEIYRYYKSLVDKFNLWKYFRLSHEVIRAEWDSDREKWCLQIRGPAGEFEDECDVFINAGGVLNDWKWPDIKGLKDFKGTLCHTARWPKDLDLKDKTIAVLGSGSSGIQVIAHVQPEVKKMFHWIRSKTWISAAFAQQFAGPEGKNYRYTDEEKQKFADDPAYSLAYRKMIESELNQRFKFIVQGTEESKAALAFADRDMRERLKGNQKLIDAIVPTEFPFGCRRPTPGNGYLEALLQPNVHTFTDGMLQTLTEKGFIDAQGVEHEVDVFVCATGFNTSFVPRFPIIANGVNIQDRWAKYPTDSYLSYAVKDTPNYLMYYGPHGPTGHGSGAPMIEALTGCFFKMIRKMQVERIRTMTIKPKACDDFNEHRELYLKRTAWAGNCSSWFKPGPKASPVMFPGNRILFIELLENTRYEDFDYTYSQDNRFTYLGTGFTTRETDGRDMSWYMGLLGKQEDLDREPDYREMRKVWTSHQ